MLKYEFKEATGDRQQEMLSAIICNYNVTNKDEMIKALGQAQAVLDCTQEQFASHPMVSISTRQLRTHKKDYLDLYTASYEKYSDTPELKNVEGVIEESALEAVYENLLARLKSPKTKTSDIAIILEYFGIKKEEFKKYTDFRNSTLRGFLLDNLTQIIKDEQTAILIKSVIAESKYLYLGMERTVGNTYNANNIDLGTPLARLEAQTIGLLFISLFNGQVTDAFINHAQVLRLLKLSAGIKSVSNTSHNQFDRMDGRQPTLKAISPKMEKDLIEWYGEKDGKEMFAQLNKVKEQADTQTAIKLPKYEIAEDYAVHLQVYPEMSEMPLRVLLARLDARDCKIKEKYAEFINEINED